MTYLRFTVRHLQRTLEDHVLGILQTTGWRGPDVPFGSAVVKFQRGRMDEAEMKAITGNLVGVSFGYEPDDDPVQLGGGLMQVEHVMFVDVIGVDETIALAIASDIKDHLAGRAPGTNRYVTMRSYLTDPPTPVAGHTLEMTEVVRDKPDSVEYRRFWQVVKATAVHISPGDADV